MVVEASDSEPPMEPPTLPDSVCMLEPMEKDVEATCHGNFLRYTFDMDKRTCQEFIYGGCYGTQNLFFTQESCEKTCAAFLQG